jgi:hypothetical protein
MTIDDFEWIPYGEIFDRGITTDNDEGVNMTGSGNKLTWIAKKGGGNDWAIYVHFAGHDEEFVKEHGQKISVKDNIRKLISCDDEMMERYRK